MIPLLGVGATGSVYGPFDASLIDPAILKKIATMIGGVYSRKFIIKVYKKTYTSQLHIKKIYKFIRHDSIILPLYNLQISQKMFLDRFQSTPSIPMKSHYDAELQLYGGVEWFEILHTQKKRFSSKELFTMWESVINIFLDTHSIIYEYNHFLTDIKSENIVMDDRSRLRLIDIEIYPFPFDPKKSYIYSTGIYRLPPQAHSLIHRPTKSDDQLQKKSRDMYNTYPFLRQIHKRASSYQQVKTKYTADHLSRQLAFFMVQYPIFVNFLYIQYYHLYTPWSGEGEFFQFIKDTLNRRGDVQLSKLVHDMRHLIPGTYS